MMIALGSLPITPGKEEKKSAISKADAARKAAEEQAVPQIPPLMMQFRVRGHFGRSQREH